MDKLIGRTNECKELSWAMQSQRSEMIIVGSSDISSDATVM